MQRLILFLAFSGLCLKPSFSFASTPGLVNVEVTESVQDGAMIQGDFCAPVSGAVAWDVITDYSSISRYVGSIDSSKIKEKTKDVILVEQTLQTQLLFYKSKLSVLLEVKETPYSEVSFKDISKQSFQAYSGSWRIAPNGNCQLVGYRAQIKNSVPLPSFMRKKFFKANIQTMLSEVQAEMLSRQARVQTLKN